MPQDTAHSIILVVEDNVDDYEALMRAFKKAPLDNRVQWCKSGKDALDYLRHEGPYAAAPAATPPALILLDLNMPGIDGKKALALIKQDPQLKHIPVLILTTSANERDIEQCYELGASTYIHKPAAFEGLIDTVKCIKNYWLNTALLPRQLKQA